MTTVAETQPNETTPVAPGRLMSVDALRGFDMFWIIFVCGRSGGGGKKLTRPIFKLVDMRGAACLMRARNAEIDSLDQRGFHL